MSTTSPNTAAVGLIAVVAATAGYSYYHHVQHQAQQEQPRTATTTTITPFQVWMKEHDDQPTLEQQLGLAARLYREAAAAVEATKMTSANATTQTSDGKTSTLSDASLSEDSTASGCVAACCSPPCSMTTAEAPAVGGSDATTATATAAAVSPQVQAPVAETAARKEESTSSTALTTTTATPSNSLLVDAGAHEDDKDPSSSSSSPSKQEQPLRTQQPQIKIQPPQPVAIAWQGVEWSWFVNVFCQFPYLQRLRSFGCPIWFVRKVAMWELLRQRMLKKVSPNDSSTIAVSAGPLIYHLKQPAVAKSSVTTQNGHLPVSSRRMMAYDENSTLDFVIESIVAHPPLQSSQEYLWMDFLCVDPLVYWEDNANLPLLVNDPTAHERKQRIDSVYKQQWMEELPNQLKDMQDRKSVV